MNEKLTVGSCFSGIGGLELGLEWTGGFETKWQIENDEYASRVLAKHWPNVKRYSDIRDVGTTSSVPRVGVICGGFPCQDVSVAGKRAGLEGKRSTLWGEMFRLVCEIRPEWVVAENVPGLLSSDAGRFFGNILRDLASAGYDVEWGVLSAAGVGAPHLRRRVFIVGRNTNSMRCVRDEGKIGKIQNIDANTDRTFSNVAHSRGIESGGLSGFRGKEISETWRSSKKMAKSKGGRLSKRTTKKAVQQHVECGSLPRGEDSRKWWHIEPDVGRVAHGVPSRVDRLKCLGNAVVPQVAQKIGEMILRFNNPDPSQEI